MHSVLTHFRCENSSWVRWYALWLLIFSQAAALPSGRVWCVVLTLAEQSESESAPESNEEEIVGETALLTARSGRSSMAGDQAPRLCAATIQLRVAIVARRCAFFAELDGRNGIGGPLRC